MSLRVTGLAVDLLNLPIIRALGEGAMHALRALVNDLDLLALLAVGNDVA